MRKATWRDLIYDEDRPVHERLFVLIVAIMSVSFAIIVVTNILTGADIRDVLILIAILLMITLTAVIAIRKQRIRAGACVIAAQMTVILLPYAFFSGGGIYGGPPIWFILSALFIGLTLTRRVKFFFLLLNLISAGVCYALAYSFPALVHRNQTLMDYIDSFVALAFISMAVGALVSFAVRLYQRESRRTERQKKEIEALNAAQSRFFSSMSHEIRTPINTIIGFNEMILREDVSEEVAEDAANIRAASGMLLHLINDILDMSRLESGNMALSLAPYRTADMLSELAGMFWSRAREKGLDFRVSVAPEVPAELIGDDVRVKQILINVLNNAVKYTREGSVTFSVQCGGTAADGSVNLIFTVTDTGIGIKKESIPYLFNAFQRVDEDKNRHIEGTGLGLSIVKQLVDLMGGAIHVNSVYTQGSTFIIELPQRVTGGETVGTLNLETRQKTGRAAYRSRFEAPQARVLVVDDNAANLLVASKLLRGTKVQVDTASSGDQALRLTLEKSYDVIFMDHMMPEMDGVECHRRIRAQAGGRCREAKIVALTANADAGSRALYERERFDGCLTKPIDADALELELQRQLPAALVHAFDDGGGDVLEESMAWIQAPQRKRAVAIATESVADLPQALLDRYEIAVIPHLVVTREGVFRDAVDLEADGLLKYMSEHDGGVRTMAPDVAAFESFFAAQLRRAHHVLFIALSPRLGNSGYPAAAEAAASFNNVTVVDSGHLSSGLGLMALEACRLAEEGVSPAGIAEALEKTRALVRTSFIVDNLDALSRAGQVSARLARVTKALSMHPTLVLRDGRIGVGKVCLGSRRRAWRKYIEAALSTPTNIDPGILFITCSGVSRQELNWIVERVKESEVRFEQICIQKASAAIAVNCGEHTFGLLYRNKEAASGGSF